jgi:hypothetical protein
MSRVGGVLPRKGGSIKGFRRLHRVMGLSLVTAALVLLWAVPGTAGAAVQLGQVAAVNPEGCAADINGVQAATVGGINYQVPVPGGVITSWSHRGITPAPAGSGRLQIWDSTGGDNWVLVGRSELEDFTAGLVTSFLTRIPVDPGDRLGIRSVEEDTGCLALAPLGNIGVGEIDAPDPAPGDERTFEDSEDGMLWNVAAVLEPDADADGFGDETQDACLGEAGPNSGCATPPANPPQPQPPPPEQPPAGPPAPAPEALTLDLGAKKQRVKKKVKFSATATADSTLVVEGKKIKDTTTELAADQKTTVKAKLKRKALNRFEEKGKGKVKIEGTASTLSGEATDTVKVKLKD